MRKIASFLLVAMVLALPATGQDAEKDDPVNPITMGKGPQDGDLVPAWIFYWLLGGSSVVCGGLLVALKALWNKLNEERLSKDAPGLTAEEHAMLKAAHDLIMAKDADGVARVYSPRTLPEAIGKLTELAQETLEHLSKLGDAREERRSLRGAFDAEKAQMRQLYTDEIKSLQGQLHQEQRERREETQQLWQKNDATTREVMGVIRDMIVALENATKVIEAYHEVEGE